MVLKKLRGEESKKVGILSPLYCEQFKFSWDRNSLAA